jgi:hypothetical protein
MRLLDAGRYAARFARGGVSLEGVPTAPDPEASDADARAIIVDPVVMVDRV